MCIRDSREAVVAAEQAAKDVEARAREDAKGIMATAQTEATEERNRILADLRLSLIHI